MTHYLSIVLFLVVGVLTGCATKPTNGPLVVTRNETVVLQPPAVLTKDCLFTTPPEAENYATASCQEKEDLLVQYSQALLANLHQCTVQQQQLRAWYTALQTPPKSTSPP